jgi:Flp pilus assembly protein TadD
MRRPATKSKPVPKRSSIKTEDRSHIPVWLIAVLLVLVTIALYWPATGYGFVNYDDDVYVTANAHVQHGLTWESIKWACLNSVAANWHPVTVWSHMLVFQAFGLKPWGHHFTNALLHALNAGLIFALLQQMTGARWRSLFVAVLFAVHPLRVESVAWVSERKDVLSGFFGLLALIFYARHTHGRRQNTEGRTQKPAASNAQPSHVSRFTFHASSYYLLSLFCFALGLMSKPMLVTWPFVMLLLDYWPLGRMQNAKAPDTHHAPRTTHHASQLTAQSQIAKRKSQILFPLLVEKIPFFALAALASFMTFVVQQHGGAMKGAEKLALGVRSGNALISCCRYLRKLFWPSDLVVFYWRPGQWPLGKVLLAGGLILGLSVLLWMQRRRFPVLLVGWLWFLGTLVPVIGLVQVGQQAMADRYTYIPSLGVLILAIWGACELTRRWQYQVMALSLAGCAAIVLCLALTRQQIGHWTDSEALFRHALAVTENNYVAHKFLGDALDKRGRIDEAIGQYQQSLRLKPDDALVCNNLGVALDKQGQTEDAISQYREVIRLEPDRPFPHYNIGNALLKQGRIDEAIDQYQQAIRLKPDYADAHNNLGNALINKGQLDAAIDQYQQAIRLKPDHADATNNLAKALELKSESGARTTNPAKR